jgi:hypothetical protein
MKRKIAVIGSGPGGSITASALAEAGNEVILIENGDYFKLNSCSPFSIEEMEQKYRNGGLTPTFGKPKISYVEGLCVGGGSEINSGLYHRLPDEILEKWTNDFQVKNFNTGRLDKYYKVIETDLSVSTLPYNPPLPSIKLNEGAKNLGWQSVVVPRWFNYSSDVNGVKQSMTETYIPRFEQFGGNLLPNTRVLKIKRKINKWYLFIENVKSGIKDRIIVEFLFICCGAIQTPALLRRSGIRHNIGNSLKVHLTIKVVARFNQKVNSVNVGIPVHQVNEFSPRYCFGGSISSKPYIKLSMLDHPYHGLNLDKNWKYMSIYYAMIIGKGLGTIRNIPYFKDPFVRYEIMDSDLELLSEALQKLCLLLLNAGAVELYPTILEFNTLKKINMLKNIPKLLPRDRTNIMTVHLLSSCPMGEKKQITATDSYGKVWGHKNLYINDGSLLPSAPGVNPQGGIMAIALRNVSHFLKNN